MSCHVIHVQVSSAYQKHMQSGLLAAADCFSEQEAFVAADEKTNSHRTFELKEPAKKTESEHSGAILSHVMISTHLQKYSKPQRNRKN